MRTGRGDATNNGACGIAVNVKAPDDTKAGIHKNIAIVQNIIEGENAEVGISIRGAKGVELKNNTFSSCQQKIEVKYTEKISVSD